MGPVTRHVLRFNGKKVVNDKAPWIDYNDILQATTLSLTTT